ncbi:MAG TPA: hypothetical protein HPP87_07955 [Planctomycetes bacterium]|nr:hypothetical protein [Planctomycetota bacterium]
MKTQCPHCKSFYAVPRGYTGGKITCKACGQRFVVAKYKKPPVVVPSYLFKKAQFLLSREGLIARLWTLSPAPFRNAFLATLGVMTALVVGWYVIVWGDWLKRPPPKQFTTEPVKLPTSFYNEKSQNELLPPLVLLRYCYVKFVEQNEAFTQVSWIVAPYSSDTINADVGIEFCDKEGFVLARDWLYDQIIFGKQDDFELSSVTILATELANQIDPCSCKPLVVPRP